MTQKRKPAWVPPDYHTDDIAALKAVWAGTANPGEQRRAMEWIIIHAAQYGELSFRSDDAGGERETAFAQGRWFVGQQVQKLIGLDARLVAKLRSDENAGPDRANDKHDRSGS
jgi:hypothetical protein